MSNDVRMANSMSMDLYETDVVGDPPQMNGESESVNVDGDVNRLLAKDLPQQLQKMLLANTELRDLAQHCHMQVAGAKGSVLPQTKVYAAQSLASVAYQINTLATDLNQLLESQTLQWQEMQHNLNNISQKIDYYNEKRSRHVIGKLTSEKPVHFMLRINGPSQKDQPMKYERRPLDFTLYDHIGHGSTVSVSSPIGTGPISQSFPMHNEVRSSISAIDRRAMMAPTISIETESIYDTSFNVLRKNKIPIQHFIPRVGTNTDTNGKAFSSSLLGQGNTKDSLYDSLSPGLGPEMSLNELRSPLGNTSNKESFNASTDSTFVTTSIDPSFIMDPLEEIEQPQLDTLTPSLDPPPPYLELNSNTGPPPSILEPPPPIVEPPPPNFPPPALPNESITLSEIDTIIDNGESNLTDDLYVNSNIPLPPLDLPEVQKEVQTESELQVNTSDMQRPKRSAPAPPPPQGNNRTTRPLGNPPRPPTSAPPPPPPSSVPSIPDPPEEAEIPSNIPIPPPDLPKDGSTVKPASANKLPQTSGGTRSTATLPNTRIGGGGDIFSEMRAKQQSRSPRSEDLTITPTAIKLVPINNVTQTNTAQENAPNVSIPDPPPDLPADVPRPPKQTPKTANNERRTSSSRPPPKTAPRPAAFDPSQISQASLRSTKRPTSTSTLPPNSPIKTIPDTANTQKQTPTTNSPSPPPSSAIIQKQTPTTNPPPSPTISANTQKPSPSINLTSPPPPPPPPEVDIHVPKDYLERMETIYTYKGQNDDELSFGKNRIIYVLKKNPDDWYEGVLEGVRGLFPANYVKKIE